MKRQLSKLHRPRHRNARDEIRFACGSPCTRRASGWEKYSGPGHSSRDRSLAASVRARRSARSRCPAVEDESDAGPRTWTEDEILRFAATRPIREGTQDPRGTLA
jgi:hypothetical protein